MPLLRFDIADLTIYFFGRTITSAYIFPFLLILLSFLFFFIYFTQILGRIWCGWLCPQTVLVEALLWMAPTPPSDKKRLSYHIKYGVFALLIALICMAGLILYTTSLPEFLSALVQGRVHFLWWLFALVIFLEIWLVGRKFCVTVCPYAMLQSIMFDADTLRIGLIPERAGECIQCNACVKVCPVGIDIRDGLSSKCVSCALCVDACGKVMYHMGKTSLVHYFFGRNIFRPFQINKIITLAIATVFLAASIITLQKMEALPVNVIRTAQDIHNGEAAYQTTFSVHNRYQDPVFLRFTLGEEELGAISLEAGEKKEITLRFVSDIAVKPYVDLLVIHGKNESKKRLEIK